MPGDFTEYMLKQFQIKDEGTKAYRQFVSQYQALSESDDVRGAWQSVWKAWGEKLAFVERQQPLAAGRRLMLEWLEERAEKQDFPNQIAGILKVEKLEDGRRFVVYETGTQKKIQQRFQIGWEAAANMSSDEVKACYKLIRALCVEGELQETSCIRDLLSVVKSGFGAIEKRLTREEAFRLAHAMRLSPEKTQDFFLRYFCDNNNDEKSYIDVKKSGDLMHLFALQYPETLPYFGQIRYAYQAARKRWENANHAPAEERAIRAAASGATDYLYSGVLGAKDLPWQAEGLSPEARRDAFIQWITSCGETVIDENGREVKTDIILPLLDVRSASATALTRVLARKTLQVALFYDDMSLKAMNPNVEPLKALPEITGVQDVILNELDAEIIRQERWTDQQWVAAADLVTKHIGQFHNYRFDISTPDETGLDFEDPWQRLLALIDAQKKADRTGVTQEHLNFPVLIAASDGSMKRRERKDGADEAPRLTQVLTGEAEARKSDILQLLLLLYSELWRNQVSNQLSRIRDDDERERFFLGYGAECLEQYRNAAAVLLKRLPGVADFYIAHFTENTIMTSILLAATVSWKYSPNNLFLELTVGNKGQHLHPYEEKEEKEAPAQEKEKTEKKEKKTNRQTKPRKQGAK